MLSIKKTIGKETREITLEDVYNKLFFLSKAIEVIIQHSSGDPVLNDAEICGLQNLQWATLEELRIMVHGK